MRLCRRTCNNYEPTQYYLKYSFKEDHQQSSKM